MRIAFVGEAPGAEEEQQKAPFVGPSGKLLDSMLKKAGIRRLSSFVGNLCQYRPPNNDLDLVDKGCPEYQTSIALLQEELDCFKPQVIVPLGNEPLKHFTGRSGILNWRGSLMNGTNSQSSALIIPTLHPAFVHRMYKWKAVVEADLARALEECLHPQPLPQRKFETSPQFARVLEFLSYCHTVPEIAFDLETTLDADILCFGIADSKDHALVIPFDGRWTPEQEAQIWQALDLLMRNPSVHKIVQNAMFDLSVLFLKYRILVRGLVMDTMLAHHACYPELPKSLAFQTSLYTREPYYKHEAHNDEGESVWKSSMQGERLWNYNAKDCCVTFECAIALQKELDELNARKGFEIDMASLDNALSMTCRGIKVDNLRVEREKESIEKEIAASESIVAQTFGEPVNTKSPKQLKKLLYDKLGYPPVLRDGRASTDISALLSLNRRFGNREVLLLLRNRQLRTQASFYNLDLHNGRIHANFNVAGTETGRWSSASSIYGGRNLMNIPEECRGIFVADEGKLLVAFDKEQAEARVVAYKAWLNTGDDSYKKLVEAGIKVHIWFGERLIARGVFPISVEEFRARETKQAKDFYLIAKKSIHGFSYGMGYITFAKVVSDETNGEVNVPLRQASEVRKALLGSVERVAEIPAIPAWQKSVEEWMACNRVMWNAFGRARVFLERPGEALLGEALANEPQGTVADETALNMVRIGQEFPECEILQQNYDSVLMQFPKTVVGPDLIAALRKAVTQPIPLKSFDGHREHGLTIPVVFKVGKNWGELEEVR